MKAGRLLFILGVFLLLTACNDAENHNGDVVESRPVLIQPLGGFPEKYADILQKRLQQIVPNVSIARPIPLASNAYFEPLHGIGQIRYYIICIVKVTGEKVLLFWGLHTKISVPLHTVITTME